MKQSIAFLTIIFLISCEQSGSDINKIEIETDAKIVKIRDCEYIKSHVHHGEVFIHCADCKNLIHLKK